MTDKERLQHAEAFILQECHNGNYNSYLREKAVYDAYQAQNETPKEQLFYWGCKEDPPLEKIADACCQYQKVGLQYYIYNGDTGGNWYEVFITHKKLKTTEEIKEAYDALQAKLDEELKND